MSKPMNHTFLVLIPKIDLPSTLDDYCPFMFGVPYKVISRLLAKRLNYVLPNQAAFIKGRRISGCVNLAQEYTHRYNYKSTLRRAFITIDFRKHLKPSNGTL